MWFFLFRLCFQVSQETNSLDTGLAFLYIASGAIGERDLLYKGCWNLVLFVQLHLYTYCVVIVKYNNLTILLVYILLGEIFVCCECGLYQIFFIKFLHNNIEAHHKHISSCNNSLISEMTKLKIWLHLIIVMVSHLWAIMKFILPYTVIMNTFIPSVTFLYSAAHEWAVKNSIKFYFNWCYNIFLLYFSGCSVSVCLWCSCL